jgi:hypothetical protein
MTTVKCLRTLVVLAPFAVGGVAAQHRPFMSAEQGGSKATVMILDNDVTLRLESKMGVRTISIDKGWTRVVNLRFSPDASRLAIVSETDTRLVTVADVAGPSVLARHKVADAAIAPDGRAVIFERALQPGQEKGIVALLPVNDAGSDAATSDIRGNNVGVRVSPFIWTDPEVVVFLDRAGTEVRAFAFQLDASGRIQNRGQKAVALQDPANVEISRIPSAGLTLRLQPTAAGAARIELRMW